ncbi:MAG: hypothetical protein HY952_01815 [Elusimicrobia bacterium]|nr:hypothetical protein [Elusimicrobiota bacterium]
MEKIASIVFIFVLLFIGSVGDFHAADKKTDKLYEIYKSTAAPAAYRSHIGAILKGREKFEARRATIKSARTEAAARAFKFRLVYAQPNPAIGMKHPVIHIEAGLADKVEVKIFDGSGALLEEATITDAPKNINGAYVYEYRFASENTPNGTCAYKVRAYRAGKEPIETSGNMVFIRTWQ